MMTPAALELELTGWERNLPLAQGNKSLVQSQILTDEELTEDASL